MRKTSRLEQELRLELKQIEEQGLTRKIKNLRFLDAVRAIDETGKEYLVFSSNNYLGLTHAPEVIAAAKSAGDYGTGSGGARLTTGGHFEAAVLEKELAAFKHTESALIFNTGYMTNLGVLYGLVKPVDVIFSDELNHASIIDGCKISKAKVKVYRHASAQDLERLLEEDKTAGNRFIVTDGVFSMDGDIAPLREMTILKEKYDALLYVDEAHATGIFGENSAGMIEECGLTPKVDIIMGTFGKALGSYGAYAASERVFIDYFINKARSFIFSTALPPSVIGANLAALDVVRKESFRSKNLLERVLYFRNLLKKSGLPVSSFTPIMPVISGDEGKAVLMSSKLKEAGYLVPAIRFPTVPKGEARLRLSLTYLHSLEVLEKLSEKLSEVLRKTA